MSHCECMSPAQPHRPGCTFTVGSWRASQQVTLWSQEFGSTRGLLATAEGCSPFTRRPFWWAPSCVILYSKCHLVHKPRNLKNILDMLSVFSNAKTERSAILLIIDGEGQLYFFKSNAYVNSLVCFRIAGRGFHGDGLEPLLNISPVWKFMICKFVKGS